MLLHENAEHSKHRRSSRFLENVGASDPNRQAAGPAFWRFDTSRACSTVQSRSGLRGAGAADRPILVHDIRAKRRTKRAQRA